MTTDGSEESDVEAVPHRSASGEKLMAFDENLAYRIRTALARKKGIEEKTLFGCFCLLLNGNVLVGVWKRSLIVRIGNEQGEDALLEPHVRPFNITGKAMKGWVVVAAEGLTKRQSRIGCSGRRSLWASCLRSEAKKLPVSLPDSVQKTAISARCADKIDKRVIAVRPNKLKTLWLLSAIMGKCKNRPWAF